MFLYVARFGNATTSIDLRRRFRAVIDQLYRSYDDEGVAQLLNGRTLGQILDEYKSLIDKELAIKEGWAIIRNVAYRGIGDDLLSLACPICGQGLSIKYDANSPRPSGETAGFLNIGCRKCNAGTVLDRIIDTPPWVDSLGTSVQTAPKNDAESCD